MTSGNPRPRMTQRCIDCLQDTEEGSPQKCESCRKKDKEFGTRNSNVHFFAGGRPGMSVDDDPDANGRADRD